ncbi:MAG: signal peptidase I [Candidatus Coproplasma sp.]
MREFVVDKKLLNKQKETNYLIVLIIFLALTACVVFFNSTFQRVYVVGSSMENTLIGAPNANPTNSGGDYVYIFEAKPARGDIVVVNNNGKVIIKRVIAVGGDKIKVEFGKVYLNGKLLDEPYVSEENKNYIFKNYSEVTLEKGQIFVLGDNRSNSNDSCDFGPCSVNSVVGIVAEWSLTYKSYFTAINTFFEFSLPSWFGIK